MFGFCAVSLSATLWPSLLPLTYIPIVVLAALLLIRRAVLLSACLLAFAWVSGYCQLLLSIDSEQSSSRIHVRGEIISLVSQNSDWLSADIQLIKPKLILAPKQMLRIRWRGAENVAIGQVYDFVLKPRTIANVLNQGGFNQQKYFLSQHIVGRAVVLAAKPAPDYTQLSLRRELINAMAPMLATLSQGDIIQALLLGDKSALTQAHIQAFRHTGTGHLVAISGLHLSVVCAWVFGVSFAMLSRLSASEGRRNLLIALLLSAVSTFFYAYLAGFSVATQRALIMIVVVLAMSLLRRYSSSWERLLWALFIVLVLDPLAVLSAGFWLSFIALAIILSQGRAKIIEQDGAANLLLSRWQKWRLWASAFWAIQWRLSLGLGLMSAMLFGAMSVHSLWINLLVVPWFSLVVIPLCLLGLITWSISAWLGVASVSVFSLANLSLLPFDTLVTFASQLHGSWLTLSTTAVMALSFTFIAYALWRVRFFFPSRLGYHLPLSAAGLGGNWAFGYARVIPLSITWFSVALSLPLLLHLTAPYLAAAKGLERSSWQVHVLDVGQGLAVVIEQSGRALIYDTGAAYGEGFSYADSVILPFLHARGLSKLDYLVVSHSDNDHAGGVNALLQAPTLRESTLHLISDVPIDVASLKQDGVLVIDLLPCQTGVTQWQGLTLTVMGDAGASKGNNGSCVLKVSDKSLSVLLTGDIERERELALVNEYHQGLNSAILISPHHGSRTSSTDAFIDAVAPELIIVPAGLNNRYGFPKPEVMHRYRFRQVPIYVTGEQGQISVRIEQSNWQVKTYRADFAPFWYNQLFRFGEFTNPE